MKGLVFVVNVFVPVVVELVFNVIFRFSPVKAVFVW